MDSWKFEVRRLPHLDDLQLLHVSDVTHDYPRHVHEEYCIAMILRGSETHISRGSSYTAIPGDLLLLNAGEAHSNRSVCVEYKSIQIHPGSFIRLSPSVSKNDRKPFFTDPVVKDPELFQSFLNLYSTLQGNVSPLEQEFELASAIEILLRDPNIGSLDVSVQPVEPSSITKVRNHLREHYSENVSLSRLASIADLSPFHLVRVFNDQIGVPPHEYQTQLRITNAQRLMRAGYSISEAAIETGFFDQSHFTRNFKRITGLTPGTYMSHSNIVQDN
jgi:AraC-like DNA-binding protein